MVLALSDAIRGHPQTLKTIVSEANRGDVIARLETYDLTREDSSVSSFAHTQMTESLVWPDVIALFRLRGIAEEEASELLRSMVQRGYINGQAFESETSESEALSESMFLSPAEQVVEIHFETNTGSKHKRAHPNTRRLYTKLTNCSCSVIINLLFFGVVLHFAGNAHQHTRLQAANTPHRGNLISIDTEFTQLFSHYLEDGKPETVSDHHFAWPTWQNITIGAGIVILIIVRLLLQMLASAQQPVRPSGNGRKHFFATAVLVVCGLLLARWQSPSPPPLHPHLPVQTVVSYVLDPKPMPNHPAPVTKFGQEVASNLEKEVDSALRFAAGMFNMELASNFLSVIRRLLPYTDLKASYCGDTIRWFVRLLMEIGAGLQDAGKSALHFAAQGDTNEARDSTRLLLETGAAKDAAATHQTPLHDAVLVGNEETIKLLLLAGVGVDARNKYSRTPLHLAVVQGNVESVRLLLQNGADKDAATNTGATPLYLAALYNLPEVARLLLEVGADKNAALVGETALHVAYRKGNLEVVGLLEAEVDKDPATARGALLHSSEEFRRKASTNLWEGAKKIYQKESGDVRSAQKFGFFTFKPWHQFSWMGKMLAVPLALLPWLAGMFQGF